MFQDAGVGDLPESGTFTLDLRTLAPGEQPRADAARPPAKPAPATVAPTEPGTGAPTSPPTGAPTSPPTGAPTAPPEPDAALGEPTAPPTAAPTAAPTQPPEEPDCVVDADCLEDQLCFGEYCVDDPDAPQEVGAGACTNPADEAVLRGNPRWDEIAQQCGLTCIGQPQACFDACVGQATGFSAACAVCYGGYVACRVGLCVFACVLGGDPQDCAECCDALCDAPLELCGGFAAPNQF